MSSSRNLLYLIILIFFLTFLIKIFIYLLPIIILIIILNFLLNAKFLKTIINHIKQLFYNSEFVVKKGQTYKQCSSCNKKADRTAKKCNNCGKSFG
jgi:hypothetical protein